MNIYGISFRLEDGDVNGRTHDERYDALQAAILDGTTKFWDQTSSFFVIESRRSIDEIAWKCKQAIEPSTDLVLVRELSGSPTRISGNNRDPDLFKLMPYVKYC
ncbi:MAG TPA: hypothetical protein VF275_01310 [Gammaproteobacteria bacterium]